MATIRVNRSGMDDGRRKWKVEKSGAVKSYHRTKDAARRKARMMARDGDNLYVHRADGTVQNEYTVGAGSEGDY